MPTKKNRPKNKSFHNAIIAVTLIAVMIASSLTLAIGAGVIKITVPSNGHVVPTSTPTPSTQRVMLGTFFYGADLPNDAIVALNDWSTNTGKGNAWDSIVSIFGSSGAPNALWQINAFAPIVSSGLIKGVIVCWQPFTAFPMDTAGACTQAIANGAYDSFITQEALRCKNAGYPIIIRLGAEMNGKWEGYGTNPTAFKEMWIKVYTLFQAAGATNVKFHWCPNFSGDEPHSVEDYYPGDAYVDYVGADVYATTDVFYKNPVNQIFTQGANPSNPYEVGNVFESHPNKPYFIGEWGINLDGGMSDAENLAWLTAFFNVIEATPRIIGMTQWHFDRFAVDTQPMSYAEYIHRVSSPLYTSNIVNPT